MAHRGQTFLLLLFNRLRASSALTNVRAACAFSSDQARRANPSPPFKTPSIAASCS